MNDRQRAQLAAYAAEADKFSENWQISRWISRVGAFLDEAMGPDESALFDSLMRAKLFRTTFSTNSP
jgi:hypothetical protein